MDHLTRTDQEKRALASSVVDYLNEIVKLDPDALHQLCETRVPCNQALSDHATTQMAGTVGSPEVGLLGILNGLVGKRADGWGYIAGVYDDDTGKLTHFQMVADVPVPA